jgi:hypothetical protein
MFYWLLNIFRKLLPTRNKKLFLPVFDIGDTINDDDIKIEYEMDMDNGIKIIRFKHDTIQTIGRGEVYISGYKVFDFFTLELPWLDNQREISCIPVGDYACKKRHSQRYENHFHVLNVPNRSYILIHHGNYFKDTLGCILPGKTLADIDGDGYRDVTHSKQTMAKLNELLPDEFEVKIINE